MSKNRYGGVDSYAAFFIAFKVRQMVRMPIFNRDDFEDLEQELMLAFIKAEASYDPSKGHRKAFIKSIINNHARNLVINAEAQKNWTGQKERSLSETLLDDVDHIELLDTITEAHLPWSDGYAPLSIEALELVMDEERIIRDMPDALRETYHILKDYSVSEAAKLTGIHRSTLSSRAQNLRKYLKKLQEEK